MFEKQDGQNQNYLQHQSAEGGVLWNSEENLDHIPLVLDHQSVSNLSNYLILRVGVEEQLVVEEELVVEEQLVVEDEAVAVAVVGDEVVVEDKVVAGVEEEVVAVVE